jgi:chromosome partitioning protein
MIITIGHTKGGVGKSTLGVNIGVARKLAGRDVWVVDADRQRTAQKALTLRNCDESLPPIPCDWYADAATLMSQVRMQASRYDDVIIECGGGDTAALRTAMALCDVMIVPFPPRSVDVWAFDELVPLINDVRAVGKDLKVYAVLNQADPGVNAADNIAAIKQVQEDYPEVELLTQRLVRRKAFSNAAGSGLSVYEVEPHDAKAVAELNALISAVFR